MKHYSGIRFVPLLLALAALCAVRVAANSTATAPPPETHFVTVYQPNNDIPPVPPRAPQLSSTYSDATGEYPLSLRNIYVSHGVLVPPFLPTVTSYSVKLSHAHDQIAITPEIDQTKPQYVGGEDHLPIISVTWPGYQTNKAEPSSAAVRRQIDLPDSGDALQVTISVVNPFDTSQKQYYVTVYQTNNEPVAVLKRLEAVDDAGNGVLVDPVVSQDDTAYSAYVSPNANSMSLTVTCAESNWATIDGAAVSNGDSTPIAREKNHHRQLLEIACGSGSLQRHYFLAILSDYAKKDIMRPTLVVDRRGMDCHFDEDNERYRCPNPRSADGKTRMIAHVEPSIRYTVENYDKSTQVRLLDGIPTIPFTFDASDLRIVAVAGRQNISWPLYFEGAVGLGFLRLFGWLLAVLLGLLLLSLLAILGLSNTLGIGTPIGVSEIAATKTLLLQYLCFANVIRGNSFLTDMTDALKWVTLYWPLPFAIYDNNDYIAAGGKAVAFGDQGGARGWGSGGTFGDVTDLTNAYGCLFWSLMIFLAMLLVHLCIISKFRWCERANTFPHRVRLGNWESRTLQWLAFPVATASTMILVHPKSTGLWMGLAIVALSIYGIWAIAVMFIVRRAVDTRQAIWVWNNSVREDGELEDEAGYWSDAACDQLLTQPVNRSLCKWFFPWRWVSTVADVDPVNVCPRMFARRGEEEEEEDEEELYPVNEFHRSHKETSYPMGKNPKTVDIIKTRAPGSLCPGQRLIAGLMRTQWLDMLMTFQGLTRFHTQVVEDTSREFVIPLTVKTCQLTGPVTGGCNHFFFDGARVPFVRIADSMYRILLGVMIGVSLASQNYTIDACLFGTVGVLTCLIFIYHAATCPYSRRIENWMIGTLLIAIATSAFSFLGYAIARSTPSIVADLFLCITAAVCFVLAAYSCIVTFSLFSALICPPLEETRFLERLANCNVTISDHANGWAVDVPAYNKLGTRDLKAQVTFIHGAKAHVSVFPSSEESSLEFDVNELTRACRSGDLRAPVVCLFAPQPNSQLGYRHLNIHHHESVGQEVASFLATDRATRGAANEVARVIAQQAANRGRGGRAIISVTVVPPRSSAATDYESSGRSQDFSTVSSSHSSSRSRRSRPKSRNGGGEYMSVEMTSRR